MRNYDKPKPLKWNTYPQWQKDDIIAEFWREYFAKYPNEGSSQELNIMRKTRNYLYASRRY